MSKRIPLAWRLIAMTLVIEAGVTAVIGWNSVTETRQLLDEELLLRGDALARSGAIYCLEPLLGLDYPLIDTFVEDLVAQDDDVLRVEVVRDGAIVASAQRGDSGHYGTNVHSAPISMDRGPQAEVFGALTLIISRQRTGVALEARQREILLMSVASFLAIAGLLAMLLRRGLGRPLEALDAHTRELSQGNLENPVPEVGGAELARLAGTLEELRVNVRDAREGLENRNSELVRIGHEKDLVMEDLSEALVRAQAAERARAEFLANMSHELCTPLNGILGMSELLAGERLGREKDDWVTSVQRSGAEMQRLVRSVLDWSAIEREAVQLEALDFDLAAVAAEALESVREKAREKGLALKLDVHADFAAIRRGDSGRVRQIIDELLDNALKFTEHGAVSCVLSGDQAGVVLEVIDSGSGVPENKLDSIFEAFLQADGSTTRTHGGAGLGLAITRRLAQLMGGSLTAALREQGGMAFTARLRLGTVSASADCEEPQHAGALTVLVVDDNAVNRKLASVVVTRGGHRAIQAANGAQALERYGEGGVDVVLMDVQMPVMDGFEATRRIRDLELRCGSRRVPILAVTAGAFEGGAERCRNAGMDGYLAKPVNFSQLLSSVRRCMRDVHSVG